MTSPADVQQMLADDIGALSLDPLGFVRYAFPWGEPGPLENESGPREWQADLLTDIGKRLRAGYEPGAAMMPVLAAVASGHGIGKTSEVSWLILWALSTFPDSKVLLTANTEQQLRTKTWPEIRKWARLLVNAHWFDVQGFSIKSTIKSRSETWRCDAVTWSVNNLESFAGLHNLGKRILLVFDEASGIDDPVWETAEGALTDLNTEIIWCVFGNPTQPSGRFFECFNRQRHRWHPRQIDSRTVPGTNRALFQEWVDDYGEDSDFVRVRVRGVFPRAGSQQFIPYDLVDAASKRQVDVHFHDPMVIGVDVARFGDDASVICFRKGRDARMLPWIKLRGVDTMELAARVHDEATRLKADAVFVDGGGVGGGVIDRLRQLRTPNVFDIQFGGKADRGALDTDGTVVRNKAAEMWHSMREWLKVGAIPADVDLMAQLTARQYGYSPTGEIQLERKEDLKKRGLQSCDEADSLALSFAYPVTPSLLSGGPQVVAQQPRTYHPHG